ncbi:hypothetical protein INT45_014089 [Circinella minor]|uniref:BZIP domain-containing protein n=1 Tax=Circinella minor TaxID=1195481 RepID=A0A8H7S5M8_9FUNG|nr:hypothetical protein INT45_014089 [Circinella minor]
MPNLSNMPLTEQIEMKTDSHIDVNRIHGMTNNKNTNNNALSENGDRRLRMLEKNRRAAARCRQRKKIWVEELTQQHQEAKRRSDELQGIILNLREEVYSLKSQILAHEGCDCHAVKDYIKIFLMNEVVQKSKFNAPSSQQGATDSVAKITTVISSVERNR